MHTRSNCLMPKALVLFALVASISLAHPAYAVGPEPGWAELEHELAQDALVAPPSVSFSAQSVNLTPNEVQTSEFFIGRVAVGIVLPESNGVREASSEDWDEAERALIWTKITTALDWWAARQPNARLSFVYDNGTLAPTPTAYEPIRHGSDQQGLWIAEVMARKGFASAASYFDQVRQYNHALRRSLQADWAFTLFIVDSFHDADGRFADGYFAYAYIHGPFAVLTSTAASYGSQYLDAVLAHEVGHIFGALDQYPAANVSCNARAGYLGVENLNSQLNGCPSNVPSIMRGGISAYASGALDAYAGGQLGWRDSDGDGILDPVDTPVSLSQTQHMLAANQSNVFTFSGRVQQSAYPSAARSTLLINRLAQVQYRVAGGAWLDAQAVDGRFDSSDEAFSFTTPPLPGGSVTIELRVIDQLGQILLIQTLARLEVAGQASARHTTFLPMLASSSR